MNLQAVLDRSIEKAGPYLRESFQMPEHSLSAAQLVRHLEGEDWTIALATVTSKGEPRVGPIGAIFHDGRFNAPILTTAARVKHVRRTPAVSASLYDANDFAVIVHGRGRVLGPDDDGFDALVEIQRARSDGRSVLDWGPLEQAAFLAIDPDVMFTFARYPERFAS
jgi:Pyridoxamine 5'-phosphate oxidase